MRLKVRILMDRKISMYIYIILYIYMSKYLHLYVGLYAYLLPVYVQVRFHVRLEIHQWRSHTILIRNVLSANVMQKATERHMRIYGALLVK